MVLSSFFEVKLDHHKKEHLYVQLYRVIKAKIISGEILANEKLPPIRSYAKNLGVNNVTIVNAYKLLEQHALVYKKIGSGTYVRSQSDHVSHSMRAIQGHLEVTAGINMASTTPSDYLFPVEDFKLSLNVVLDRDKGSAFGYQDSRGYEPLREVIVEDLKRLYGIESVVDSVQILSGAQQGLDVVAKALVQYGDTVIVEAPTYTGAVATFRSRGARILELPMESDGPNIMKLREFLYQYRPKLLYIMPNFQNPTGIVYSTEKREALLALSTKHQLVIIEDDYCSELSFCLDDLAPIKSLDYHENVIYIKSFSKALMPGLRLGYMITPERLRQQVMLAKQSTDIVTSGLTQRAFEHFITSGAFIDQKRRMYDAFKVRYFIAKEAIEFYLHELCSWGELKGGLHFWIRIETGVTSKYLYEALKKRGVLIASGDVFFATKVDSPYFRLSIAGVDNGDLVYGIRSIADTLSAGFDSHEKASYQMLL
jgi:2-aminoadipate transaminase